MANKKGGKVQKAYQTKVKKKKKKQEEEKKFANKRVNKATQENQKKAVKKADATVNSVTNTAKKASGAISNTAKEASGAISNTAKEFSSKLKTTNASGSITNPVNTSAGKMKNRSKSASNLVKNSGITKGVGIDAAKKAVKKANEAQETLEKKNEKTVKVESDKKVAKNAEEIRKANWKGEKSYYEQEYQFLVDNNYDVGGLSKDEYVEKKRKETFSDRKASAEKQAKEENEYTYSSAPMSTNDAIIMQNVSQLQNGKVKVKTNEKDDSGYAKDKNGNILYDFKVGKDGKMQVTPRMKEGGKNKNKTIETDRGTLAWDRLHGTAKYDKKGRLVTVDKNGEKVKFASEKVADQRAGFIHDSTAAAGFMQGMGYADIRKGIGQFSDAAEKDVNKITMEGGMTSAWNLGYMGGFGVQMGVGGVNSMAKSLTKAGAFKTARGALAATVGKNIAVETPVNVLDSIKMATDASGNTNYKAAAGYMVLNTIMSGGIPAIMEGAGGLIKKHESKELLGLLAKEQELAKAGRSLPESDMVKYDKLVGKMAGAVEDQVSAASVIAGRTLDKVASSSDSGFIKVTQANVKRNAENVAREIKDSNGNIKIETSQDAIKAEALKDHYAKTGNSAKVLEMQQAVNNSYYMSKLRGDDVWTAAQQMQKEQFAKDIIKKADIKDEHRATNFVDNVKGAIKDKAYIDGNDMEGLRGAIEYAKATKNDALLKSAEVTLRAAKNVLQNEAKALERRFKPLTKKTGGNIVVGTSEDLAKVLEANGKNVPEGKLVNGFRVGKDIYVNIESPERHSFTIAHELTHIMEDSAESFGELINLVKKYDSKAWEDELKNVAEVYSGVTDEFEREVAGNVLGKLIADQDFLHALYKKDANLFQKIYDILRSVVTGTDDGFTVPKEYEDIYNTWDKALNELGGKESGNNVDLSIMTKEASERAGNRIQSANLYRDSAVAELESLQSDFKQGNLTMDEFEDKIQDVYHRTGWSLEYGGAPVFNMTDKDLAFTFGGKILLNLGDLYQLGGKTAVDKDLAGREDKYKAFLKMFPEHGKAFGEGAPISDIIHVNNSWRTAMDAAYGGVGGNAKFSDTKVAFAKFKSDTVRGRFDTSKNTIYLSLDLIDPASGAFNDYVRTLENRISDAAVPEERTFWENALYKKANKTDIESGNVDKEGFKVDATGDRVIDDGNVAYTFIKETFLHESTHAIQTREGLEPGGSSNLFKDEAKLPDGKTVSRPQWFLSQDPSKQSLLDSLNVRRDAGWFALRTKNAKAYDLIRSATIMLDSPPVNKVRGLKTFFKSDAIGYAQEMVNLLRDGKGLHEQRLSSHPHTWVALQDIKTKIDTQLAGKDSAYRQAFWNDVGELLADDYRAWDMADKRLRNWSADTAGYVNYKALAGEQTAREVQESMWRGGEIGRFDPSDTAPSSFGDKLKAGTTVYDRKRSETINASEIGKTARANILVNRAKYSNADVAEAEAAFPNSRVQFSLSKKGAEAEVDKIASELRSENPDELSKAVKEYETLQKERDALPNDVSALDKFEEIEEKMENLFKSQEEYETAVETLEKSAKEEVDAIAKANESDTRVKKMLDDYRPISESLKEYGIDYSTSGKVYKIDGIGEYKMRKKGEFPAYYTRSLDDDSWVRITPEALHNNLMTAKRVQEGKKVDAPTQKPRPTKSRETVDDFDEFTATGTWKEKTTVEEPKAEPKKVADGGENVAKEENITPQEAVAISKKSPSKEEYNATAIRMRDDAMGKYGTRKEVREMINKNLMDSVKYNGKSAKEAEAQATRELNDLGFEELKKKYLSADFNDDPKILVARWNKLAEYIDKQIDAGKDAAEWYAHREEIDLKCTQISNFSGRGTQAMKDILTSTRAGRLRVVDNEIKKLQRMYHTRIDGDLTVDKELLERLAEAEGTEKEELLHEINKQLWEQIPASLMERINEYRHCFMLFNVKTHGRNIIGNGAFRLARAVSDYGEAKLLQSRAVKSLAEKKGFKNMEVDKVPVSTVIDVKPNVEHLDAEFNAIYEKSNSRNKYIEMGRPQDVPTVKWDAMQKLINKNYDLLEKEDLKGALKPAFRRAYVSWCKARLPEGKTLTEFMESMTDAQKNKARHYALAEGEYATFRDSCAFSDWLIGKKQTFAGKQGNTAWGTMGYRALDVVLEGAIPFVKTPVNIFRRSLDFSPFGLLRGATNLATAKSETAFKNAIHDISTGMTGTAMCGFGAFLAAEGIVTVKAGEVSGDKYYDSDMGFQDYSINVAGHSWTLDWAQPMQMSLFAGAAFIKGLGDGWSPQEALNMFFAVTSPLTDTSFMSSPKDTISRFVENAGRGSEDKDTDFAGALAQLIAGDIPKNYISGLVPQLVAQTAGFTDVYNFDKKKTLGENFAAYGKAFVKGGQIQRDTRGTAENSFVRGWQSAGRQLLNKVPVLRQMYLNPKLDRRGNNKVSESTETDWNIAVRLVNAFANPASVKEITFDKTDKELIAIRNHMDKSSKDYKCFYYNFTGNPSYALADVKGFKGRRMTYDEAYTYGKANRIKQNTMVEDMINAKSYKGMTWKMKADEVSDAHWVGTTVADLKTYGANYAVRALLKNNEGEKDDFTNYKIFKGTGEATNKAFVDYFIEKETMLARAHCDSTDIYKIKAAIAVRKGDKELLSALYIHKGNVEDMTKYVSKMRKKAEKGGEKLKKLIFDDITDFTCSAASHIDSAGVNSSTSAKSLALGICAAEGDKKAELTYRGMGYTWNKAQAGGGLALKYGVNGKKGDEALVELTKIKAEVRRNDADGSGSYTKGDITAYIDKKMKNASADEKACMFESLSNGDWNNPYKAEINDHLEWGENRDGDWGEGKSGGGRGRGWGHGHGGGGGSSKGKMPKTDSGAIKGKVSNPFSNTGKPSNLNDAYRKKLKKLREQTR